MMNTKKLLAAMALLFVPLATIVAQDDVYFVNKRAKQAKAEAEAKARAEQEARKYVPVQIVYADEDEPVNVSGSKRDVDEYNRRGRSVSQGRYVESPDGTFTYQLPGNDTLYIMEDSMAVTTRSLANDVYAQGYNEGYQDGEDYAYTRRLNRFGYGGAYASPWYYSYYDPFFYDDWYWGYDPYWYGGYYGWHRPYWGYGGYYGWRGYYGYYDPYWYGGYYGWGYPYYGGFYIGGRYGRPHNSRTDGAHTSRYRGQTGRSAGYNRGRGTSVGVATGSAGARTRTFGSGQSTTSRSATVSAGRSNSTTNTSNRTSSFGTSRSSTSTYSGSSSSTRSGSFGSSSSSGSSRSGGFSGGGGGFSGGSRGGGGGRGR
ncbi:MAG: hypothetical protein IJ209_08475 [Bacteroidaceae bacterium]|nr:hypothetical protein [Bacteroidaceae bacterium]